MKAAETGLHGVFAILGAIGALFGLAAASGMAPGPAQAQEGPPSYFRVAPLEPGDTLAIRRAPSAGSERLGGLAPGAGPVEAYETRRTGSTLWTRIIWEGENAWVAKRFLVEIAPARLAETALPIGLACAGTEPFWSATIRGARALETWSLAEGGAPQRAEIATAMGAAGRLGWPAVVETTAGDALLVRPGRCSDGMSDADYPWLAAFTVTESGARRLYEGCCGLPAPR